MISLCYRRPFLYVGDDSNRVHIVDLSEPEHPERVGGCKIGDYPNALGAGGNHLFLAAHGLGFLVVDLSKPPSIASRVDFPKTEAHELAVTKNYAYLATADGRLHTLDIGLAKDPQLVSSLKLPRPATRVSASWPRVLVGLAKRHLAIVDVSSARDIRLQSVTKVDDDINGIAVVDHLAFLAMSRAGLAIMDVADPRAPRAISNVEVAEGDMAGDVVVRDGTAFVLTVKGRLHAIDVADARHPKRLATYAAGGPGSCLVVAENAVVVGLYQKYSTNGIEIVNFGVTSHAS